MKYLVSPVFLISLFINCIGQISLHEWNDSKYNKYTFESFCQLPVVNQQLDPGDIDYPLLNATVFYYTNEQRIIHKKEPFKHSAALEKAAFSHSSDMVEYNFYSHESPVKGKKSMSDRLVMVGVTNAWCAENIFDFFVKDGESYLYYARKIISGWMDSPLHRENILNER